MRLQVFRGGIQTPCFFGRQGVSGNMACSEKSRKKGQNVEKPAHQGHLGIALGSLYLREPGAIVRSAIVRST